jgi:hypothetical protein
VSGRRRAGLVVGLLLASVVAGAAPAAAGSGDPVDDPGILVLDTSLSTDRPVPDENFTLTTTVSAPDASARRYVVREVSVREGRSRNSDPYNATDPDRWVESGGDLSQPVSLHLDESGEQTVYVHVRLVGARGDSYSLVEPVPVEVFRPHPQVAVEAASSLPGADGTLNVTVANGRSDGIRSLRLRTCGGVDVENPTRVVSSLSPGSTRSVTYTIPDAETGPREVCLDLSYRTANGTNRSVSRQYPVTVRPPENPGDVALTGLTVTRENDTLVVSGSAGNVGGSDVGGVVVSVGEGEDVSPASGRASYFVGGVAESDFSSFEVRAALAGEADGAVVPLRVAYVVDGVPQETTASVRYEAPERPQEPSRGGGFPLGIEALAGAGALLVVGVVGWRRFDGR